MKKKTAGMLLVLMILTMLPAPCLGDFSSSGVMSSPADLVLIPESRVNSRFWVPSNDYSWSYAPLFFRPDERVDTEVRGSGPFGCETGFAAEPLKLPGASVFTLGWDNGWRPDSVSVAAWEREASDRPDRAEDDPLKAAEPVEGAVTLEPDRVYLFRAIWEKDAPDEEYGTVDYYVVTEWMTEAEAAAARARTEAPFSGEDLEFLTLRIGDAVCILGTTTPRDLAKQGLSCDPWGDSFTVRLPGCDSGEFYVYTENSSPDAPVLSLNAFWAYDMPLDYCGFDGIIGDPAADPDNIWLPEEDRWTAEELREALEDDDFQNRYLWSGMVSWMGSCFHMDESSDGIYSVVVTLSNGRELKISSHDSPVSLALLPE